jgi:inositol-pentakisphosphate 2-kinase
MVTKLKSPFQNKNFWFWLTVLLGAGRSSRITGFCPLDLVSGNQIKVSKAVGRAFAKEFSQHGISVEMLQTLASYYMNSPILARLRELQKNLHTGSVFNVDPSDKNFLTLMTLRDCSLYIKVNRKSMKIVDACLGDLDLKSPSKIDRWKATERKLIEGGWYEKEFAGLDYPCAVGTRG